MRARRARRYLSLSFTVAILAVALIVSAPPALAYKQKTLSSNFNFEADGLFRTVGGASTLSQSFTLPTGTLAKGSSKHVQGKVKIILYSPTSFTGQVDTKAGIACYRPTTPRDYRQGSLGTTNWATTNTTVVLRVDHLFVAPYDGSFKCRLVVAGKSSTPPPGGIKMRVVASSTETWLRMSDSTPTDGRLWYQANPDLFIGTPAPDYVDVSRTQFIAKPTTLDGYTYFWSTLRATTCKTTDTDVCPAGANTGSTIQTRLIVKRYDLFGNVCSTSNYPTSGPFQTTITVNQHHRMLNHPTLADFDAGKLFYVSDYPIGACTNKYDVYLRVTHVTGAPVWIDNGTTSGTEATDDGDPPGKTVTYYMTQGYAYTLG